MQLMGGILLLLFIIPVALLAFGVFRLVKKKDKKTGGILSIVGILVLFYFVYWAYDSCLFANLDGTGGFAAPHCFQIKINPPDIRFEVFGVVDCEGKYDKPWITTDDGQELLLMISNCPESDGKRIRAIARCNSERVNICTTDFIEVIE